MKDRTRPNKTNNVSNNTVTQGHAVVHIYISNEAKLAQEQVNQFLSLLKKQKNNGSEPRAMNPAHFAGKFCLLLKVQVLGY